MKKNIFCCLFFIAIKSFSQDSLPKFYTKVLSNSKVQISWINPYQNKCVQVSVQHSYDSLKFYTTVFSSLSPELPENGFVDNNFLPQMRNYYRIFYVLDDGKYFFTTPINPQYFNKILINNNTDTTHIIYDSSYNIDGKLITIPIIKGNVINKKMYTIYKRKTTHLAYVINEVEFAKFKDSIATNTKDTLQILDNEIAIWNPYIPPPAWKPSINIYATAKGNVAINLPNYIKYKYKVIFYNSDDKELFKIKNITYPKLTLDKGNFLKAGWYFFEIFENEKLLEKNKFLLESDF